MHNDVKQCFGGSNVHCGSCSYERIQYDVVFSEAENLNAEKLSCVLMWLSRRVAARTICLSDQKGRLTLDLAVDPVLLLFSPLHATILDLSVTTAPIPSFGACYVIMHKVYFIKHKKNCEKESDTMNKT